MRSAALALLAVAAVSISLAQAGGALAHPHAGLTTYKMIGEGIAVERTELVFEAPLDNTLPWAFVEGKVENHVAGYPVIIQIHERGGEAARFGQVDVGSDGSFEYKFRVYGIEDGQTVRAFVGEYDVTVYKVVHTDRILENA